MDRAVQTHTESIEITAPPQHVYAIVADVTKASELSPESQRCEWIGEPAAPVVGARLRGHNRWRGFSWTRESRITTADPGPGPGPGPGPEFAFHTIPGRGIYHDQTKWQYEFQPTENGTLVTESYAFHAPTWLRLMDAALGRPAALARGMRATLTALKHTAEHTH